MTRSQTLAPRLGSPASPAVDGERALEVLLRAFEDDPPVRWLYPCASAYASHFRDFARALGGSAIAHATLRVADGAAALWLQPGAGPDEDALEQVVDRSVPRNRQDDVLAVFAEMGGHHPEGLHWYLPLIGVVPERQGQGLGTALMTPILARSDAEGLPVYLEATTERSRALYARLGFETTAVIRMADCPPIWPMVRTPKGRVAR